MLEQQQTLNSETPAASGEDAPTKVRRYENPQTTMHIRKIWRRVTTTRHARTLEAELALERAVIARLDASIAQQCAEINQQGIEFTGQGALIDQQRAEISEQHGEIARLRAENRALLNSILGIAGLPPLPATEADLAAVQSSPSSGTGTPVYPENRRACALLPRSNPSDLGSLTDSRPMNAGGQAEACPTEDPPAAHATNHSPLAAAFARNHSRSRANPPHVAAPTRRRSWPQIHRLLEFESTQKEKPAADPLPPAHH